MAGPQPKQFLALDGVPILIHSLRAFAEENSLKLGSVAQPLRAALTGRTTSPGIFEVLDVLGCQESLGRLKDQAKD